uniref:Uncharacterized protein n=1 Tax=Sphaerodactylus townsendi TaxID=933632 RepID=A0ACB8FQR6_9SAUR
MVPLMRNFKLVNRPIWSLTIDPEKEAALLKKTKGLTELQRRNQCQKLALSGFNHVSIPSNHAAPFLGDVVVTSKLCGRISGQLSRAKPLLPHIIPGLVDHIALIVHREEPQVYQDLHCLCSLNIQASCNPQYIFTDLVAKDPGHVNNAQIFAASGLNHQLAM